MTATPWDDPDLLAGEPELDTVETHISRLWFTPDRVYKVLKPLALGFLDHSSPEARMQAIDDELRLNRRLSPDVYLGTADILEGDTTVDRMLVMRRLPVARRLLNVLNGPAADDALRSVAKEIAAFHAGLPGITEPVGIGTRDGLRDQWESSLAEIEPAVGSVIDPGEFEAVRRLALNYLEHRGPLFEQRIADGFIRDGHGDLTAADIFILDDGPRILDCLAFDDGLRICDVLADIAFLIMDLHRLAGRSTARQVMALYDEFSGEAHPSSLAHHYVAYRAHVRAKIEVIRHRQGVAGAARAARSYHALTLHHLKRAQNRLIVIGGGPASGKTSISQRAADLTGWLVLSSDELRKDMLGLAHHDHTSRAGPGEAAYDSATTDRVYTELLRRAEALIEAGESVILDASWTSAQHRKAAGELAVRLGAEFTAIDCVVPRDEALRRLAQRGDATASDATPDVIDHLAASRDPWPDAIELDTKTELRESVDLTISYVCRT